MDDQGCGRHFYQTDMNKGSRESRINRFVQIISIQNATNYTMAPPNASKTDELKTLVGTIILCII